MKRSTLPFQRGVRGGMRMGRAPISARDGPAGRAQVGARPGLEDARLLGRLELPGAGPRCGRAALQAAQGAALLTLGHPPAVPPAVGGRRGHAEPTGGRPQARPLLLDEAHELPAPTQSGPTSSVFHVRALLVCSCGKPQTRVGLGRLSGVHEERGQLT